MTILNQLQNYNWSHSNVENIKEIIRSKNSKNSDLLNKMQGSHNFIKKLISENENSNVRRDYHSKFRELFNVKNDVLYYKPLSLQIIPKDDEKEKENILNKHFHGPEGIGKGQNNFHSYILSKYIGITRDDVIAFLKKQPEYQLFQNKPRISTVGIQPKRPLHIIAIDTVDITNMKMKYYNYIFSAMDIYTGFCWFFLMKKHEASDSVKSLKKIFEYNLRFRDPATRENMITNQKYDLPHMIISDQGSEFKSEFQEFLRTMKIKQKFQKSYTPQPHIEAVNGVLRNIIRSYVIRSGSKTLNHDIMEKLMKAKNTNTDPDSRTTPESLMKDYFLGNSNNIRELVHQKTAKKRQKSANKTRRYNNQKLEKDDFVRVKLSNFQSGIRSLVKSGETKKIFIRFSPEVYIIEKVIEVKQSNFGFPLYILKNSQNRAILNASGKKRIFQGSDLLKVPHMTPSYLNLKKVNALNDVKGDRGRDLFIKSDVSIDEKPSKSRRVAKPKQDKPMSEWKGDEWRKFLINKEFSDEGKRWIISDVNYSQKYKIFMATHRIIGQEDNDENNEIMPIDELLPLLKEG
jgi:hypothetical protein